MDCVNHSGVNTTAYCQNCGKALCAACVRKGPAGQILCEPCWVAWRGAQPPYGPPFEGAPSPGLAAFLGLIPGVGAMYNGQFIKGLVHVFIFAVLVSAAHIYGVFGIFIAGWVLYQSFEAYHTAKARRDGEPLPDPLGLNDVGQWFGAGGRPPQGMPPGTAAGPASSGQAGAYQAANQGVAQGPATGQDASPTASQASYQPPSQAPYQAPFPGPFPPQIPPVPPMHWRRREPIGAIVLIALGILFLLGQFDWFSGRVFEFSWPVLLIGLGVWLIVRRMRDSREDPQGGPQ